MHHEAVKFTNTGLPEARWASTTSMSKPAPAAAVGRSTEDAVQTDTTARAATPSQTGRSRAGRRMPSQARNPTATNAASTQAAPPAPACCTSTQTSQTTVANIGNAMACFSVAIQGPGRGSRFAIPGTAATTTYGSAMPTPSATMTASRMGAGWLSPYPIATPMNGTVHGVATTTASIPVANGPARSTPMPKPGVSRTPSRFSPSTKNSTAMAATKPGDCN